MIGGKLNQTAVWKRKTGDNVSGESIFADPVTIKVRWENKRRLVRDASGKEVWSESLVFCVEAVKADDLLTFDGVDHIVINSAAKPNLAGTFTHREVSC